MPTNEHTKHSIKTDALDTLGNLITESEKRDAIHLAVEPVQAAHHLRPGDHVGFNKDGKATLGATPVGIVDPFLQTTVQGGQWFWLIVYPRQITSLRHVWTHPAFPEPTPQTSLDTPAVLAVEPKDERKIVSEHYLRDNMGSYDTYENFIEVASTENSEYLTIFGSDASGPIPDEFWYHLEVVTGKKRPKGDRPEYFSCSC